MRKISVVDYDPAWPEAFEHVRSRVWPALSDIAIAIEHVGSTSVPGLAAKPIIDISVVVPGEGTIPLAIHRLGTLGYLHRGNLGIEGREAFHSPDPSPAHNLYLCPRDSIALANHLTIRDHLRANPDAAKQYGALKKQLAGQFPTDIDGYIAGKTAMLLQILRSAGFPPAHLSAIERAKAL